MRSPSPSPKLLRSRVGAGLLVATPLAAVAVAAAVGLPADSETSDQTESRSYSAPNQDTSGGYGSASGSSAPGLAEVPDLPASGGAYSGLVTAPGEAPRGGGMYAAPVVVTMASNSDIRGAAAGAALGALRSTPAQATPSATSSPVAAPAAAPAAPPSSVSVEQPAPVAVTPAAPVDSPPVVSTPVVSTPVAPTNPPAAEFTAPVVSIADGASCVLDDAQARVQYTIVLTGGSFQTTDPFTITPAGTWVAPQSGTYPVVPGAENIDLSFPAITVVDPSGVSHAVSAPEKFSVPLALCSAPDAPVTAKNISDDAASDSSANTDSSTETDPLTDDVDADQDMDLIYQELLQQFAGSAS